MSLSSEVVGVEVQKLKDMKLSVRKFTGFGDNNHEAIDAQIMTLEEDFSEDEVYEKQDDEEWTENQVDSAMDAIRWRDEDEEAPSESWAPLIQK